MTTLEQIKQEAREELIALTAYENSPSDSDKIHFLDTFADHLVDEIEKAVEEEIGYSREKRLLVRNIFTRFKGESV